MRWREPRPAPPTAGPPSMPMPTTIASILKHVVIMDVEVITRERQAEVTAAKTMIERAANRLEVMPSRLAAEHPASDPRRPRCSPGWSTSAGSSRTSRCSTSRSAPTGPSRAPTSPTTRKSDAYACPAGKQLRKHRRPFAMPRIGVTKDNSVLYRASKFDCDACALKARRRPKAPARKVPRSIHEAARDKARAIAKTEVYVVSRRERKKIEMLSLDLNASSDFIDYDYEVLAAPAMSFLRPATAQKPQEAREAKPRIDANHGGMRRHDLINFPASHDG